MTVSINCALIRRSFPNLIACNKHRRDVVSCARRHHAGGMGRILVLEPWRDHAAIGTPHELGETVQHGRLDA